MIYLLHFDRPISPDHTCQHYLGSTDELPARLNAHRHGRAARLTQVAAERGIGFELVRLWQGGRAEERALKAWKCAPRLCPLCSDKPKSTNLADMEVSEWLQ